MYEYQPLLIQGQAVIAETLLRNQEEGDGQNEDNNGRPGSSSSTGRRPPSSADSEPFEVIDERTDGKSTSILV